VDCNQSTYLLAGPGATPKTSTCAPWAGPAMRGMVMRPIRLLKITDPAPLSRWRRRRPAEYGPRGAWRRTRLAAVAVLRASVVRRLIAAIVVAVTVIAAAPAVAGAVAAHHSLADNGVISSHN
jgi:hypothetical protein